MDARNYNGMENILQLINAKYISLSDDEIKRNNVILIELLPYIVSKMKQKSQLFNSVFKKIFYGGSYYDGLKVGSPNEYDIDLLFKFPSTAEAEIVLSDKPGFVQIYLHNPTGYERFCNFQDQHYYLDNQRVLRWMEGVVQTVFNDFPMNGSRYIVDIGNNSLFIRYTKGGPAFTLHITGTIDDMWINMDVDLVPCFDFESDMWPASGFRQNPFENTPADDFFIVPKAPAETMYRERFWRLSFQIQERILIQDKQNLKPAIRLLKKMRNTLLHDPISSYYLKTVALWETEQLDSWRTYSLSNLFMHILKRYRVYISNREIPYYWDIRYNLLENIGDTTLNNISNYLKRIIKDIDDNVSSNPNVVVKYLLTPAEYEELFPTSPTDDDVIEDSPAANDWCTIL